MNDSIQTIEYLGHTINTYYENDSESPREWDNFGTMVCFHKRYNLGDNCHGLSSNQFDSFDELEEYLIKEENALIILPLSLYDHSGITMYVGMPNCRWDSGQVGFIYVTRQKILDVYGKKRLSKKLLEKAEKCLKSEVETYDKYLRGEVFGYMIEGPLSQDSCWGFYDQDDMIKEAKSSIEYEVFKGPIIANVVNAA